MSNPRIAALRYQALDSCFSDRTRFYFIEDLLEAVNQTLKNNSETQVSRRKAELQKIVLQVAPNRLPYILSKPLHPSQHNRRASEGIIVLKVVPNKELYQLLLSFGPDIEILEPAEIRLKMADYAQQMVEKYNNVLPVQKDYTKEL